LKENEDAANEKQMEGQFNIVHEIKMKKKAFLARPLPLADPSLGANFVLEVKKNWDVTNPSKYNVLSAVSNKPKIKVENFWNSPSCEK
jgi:hypothetical protein